MVRVDKRKCDRCESEYEPHPNVLPNTTVIPAMYKKVDGGLFGSVLDIALLDTCDKCLEELQNWWDNTLK